ncbi:glycoside hydrolase family 16 protein [Nocardioides panacisoli]|uniref:Glycoside hydrolase family 16 protein n=1 Tax=Nocardioides panacisoli TaxID=627624 RepID=A0ABP7IW33_9ACTN
MRNLTRAAGVVLISLAILATACVEHDGASGAPSSPATSGSVSASTSPAPTTPPAAPCAGEHPRKADGGTYTCTFDDEFTGTTIDTTKWQAGTTARSGLSSPNHDCYVALPGNMSVSFGSLHLTAKHADHAFTCKSPRGDFTTEFTGASLTTRDRFSQAYGRVEFRARFPQATTPGVHSALWMNPATNVYGAWPLSGEIDVAEWFSADAGYVYPTLHYGGARLGVTHKCEVPTPGDWHQYAVEWTKTSMRFLYDGVECWKTGWKPVAPVKPPAPFDQPFNIVMNQVFGGGWNAVDELTPTSVTMDVDWVRAWK